MVLLSLLPHTGVGGMAFYKAAAHPSLHGKDFDKSASPLPSFGFFETWFLCIV